MDAPQSEILASAVVARIAAGDGPLSGAPREWLGRLVASGKLVRADLGKVLVAPGKMPPHVFVVVEGRVRLLGTGIDGKSPELLQTVGPGGILGWASLQAGVPVEAATAAEDCVCLMLESGTFREIVSGESELRAKLEGAPAAPELHHVLAVDFARRAVDVSKAPRIVRSALGDARVDASGSSSGDDFTWWVAEGAARGAVWTPAHGTVRRVGLPSRYLAA